MMVVCGDIIHDAILYTIGCCYAGGIGCYCCVCYVYDATAIYGIRSI
jgi:hypothetical protein